jgi:uncharacterized protein YgbK (DUF1537 family)
MGTSAKLFIAFYGDDFTGSTDALEQLTLAGIKTVLFIDVPSEAQLAKYPDLEGIGIAGMTRSLSPTAMQKVLEPAFKALAKLNPQHIHYKVCSTFDSSPTIGSIGKAIDVGVAVFHTAVVPLLVAVPKFGRYALFGNLFARMGIGSNGGIYRLDRHPSMSKHPSTPANESDLSIHLSKQTKKRIGLFDLPSLHRFEQQPFEIDFGDSEIVLFDAVKQEELQTIGQIIDSMKSEDKPLFLVGSSGIEMALGAFWAQNQGIRSNDAASLGVVEDKTQRLTPNTKRPTLVISGSCSAVTADQIEVAIRSGFEAIAVDTAELASEIAVDFLVDDPLLHQKADEYAHQLLNILESGKSVILHTSLGSTDPRLKTTNKNLEDKNLDQSITAKLYGTLLGLTAKNVAAQFNLNRIIIAGGDTSSYAARAMEIEAVEIIASLSPGAPICLAHAHGAIDQLQVVFKGGQVGSTDFFVAYNK